MKIFSKSWLLPKAKTIFWILVIAIIVTSIFYIKSDEVNKLAPVLGGLLVGLFLVLIQFMFSWSEHIERESYQLLGLKNILKSKKNREYYGALIKGTKMKIDLMGRTCSHFLEDFADEDGGHTETRFLYDALARNVKVRFLLPCPNQLDDKYRAAAEASQKQLEILKQKFDNFHFRYFEHREYHSLFVADNDVILGPFFPNLRSMDTPALHLNRSANLPEKYLEYFQQEWELCKDPS